MNSRDRFIRVCQFCLTGNLAIAWLPRSQDSNPEHYAWNRSRRDYNMVGGAVAMVTSTMHEKSCIDSHNARKCEKSSTTQSFTHLAITMMKLRKYHSHEFLKES